MTDWILALILIFVVLAWAEHSAWVADRRRVGRKWKAKLRKKIKNMRTRRRNRREARRNNGTG